MNVHICRRDRVPEEVTSEDVAVVVDALRASVTAAVLLDEGARTVRPVEEIPDSMDKAVLLVGERDGRRIEGAHFGNSPTEIRSTDDAIENRDVILRTTNGTKCVDVCREAGTVYMGSLANRRSLIEILSAHHASRRVLFVPAGRRGAFAPEDLYSSVCLQAALLCATEDVASDHNCYPSDEASQVFAESETGEYLATLGYQDDVTYCARADVNPAVPRLDEGVFVDATTS